MVDSLLCQIYLEAELEQYCLDMDSLFFGVRIDDLRRLAYEIAEANGVQHNFDREKKIAGWIWHFKVQKRRRLQGHKASTSHELRHSFNC